VHWEIDLHSLMGVVTVDEEYVQRVTLRGVRMSARYDRVGECGLDRALPMTLIAQIPTSSLRWMLSKTIKCKWPR
jgi:hypothetical protein